MQSNAIYFMVAWIDGYMLYLKYKIYIRYLKYKNIHKSNKKQIQDSVCLQGEVYKWCLIS